METFIVKTEKTVFGGNTIAKINGKAVFIPYSMPEETLEISRMISEKNDIQGYLQMGQTILILNPELGTLKLELNDILLQVSSSYGNNSAKLI